MKFSSKVAIVTGGARGLGKAYALRLSEQGARVVVADVLDAEDIKDTIEKRGGEVLCLRTDVSQEEGTIDMARRAIERFGTIDILINNAALFANIRRKPFYEISGHEWDEVIRVNLKGTFLCCKAVYPQMRKQGKGKIVNISSAACFRGQPNFIHYVTSKEGIIGFTRALAREVGNDGICVNAVAPGYTLSDIIKEKPMDSEDTIRAVIAARCFKRGEEPEDIVGAILFLASDESDFISGQTIVVDGGSIFH